jgi:hypothetical protein
MNLSKKPTLIISLTVLGAIAAPSVSHAQPVMPILLPGGAADTGTSYLSDVLGSGPGSPESLLVNWSVQESMSGVYSYSYNVYNPPGDIQLPGSVSPGSPEIVDYFSVNFNANFPGALVAGPSGGLYNANNGPTGLAWFFAPVQAGTTGPTLTYSSDLPPIFGNANASDANPPSPWSSSPGGQEVPIPAAVLNNTVPEPATAGLLGLGGVLLTPYLTSLRRKFSARG